MLDRIQDGQRAVEKSLVVLQDTPMAVYQSVRKFEEREFIYSDRSVESNEWY